MTPRAASRLRFLERADWQMPLADRAALLTVLGQLEPELSIEIGTAQGASLETIAAHSGEVHAFDLTSELVGSLPANATFHEGDSRVTLPRQLEELAAAGRSVDFALVDGDHSAEGVASDLGALLASAAVTDTVILLHDALNPEVRAGIAGTDPAAHDKIIDVDLDFVPGRRLASGPLAGQLWGGFAIVLVGERGGPRLPRIETRIQGMDPIPLDFEPVDVAYSGAGAGGEGPDPAEVERLRAQLDEVQASVSWRLTAPLRALRRR